ncbi:hypothetical protein MVEN_00765700 [Mycena venus]|uniref:ARM repeat-containing protein n=1 Tax=Mycena venus TaxID=2733690 RepID=A0A8H6YFS2_9AGAR|nr:hypothetical protein MVEN_00765700 [Mycena venus]
MPPLTRQDTRPSIHSWWSDSNPGLRGPTINLHAAAKPLMKLMYHRQVLEFIKKNRGSPLSTTALEKYSSYFPWDYVSITTKVTIFLELASRAESDVDDARAVVDSPVFDFIAQTLWSPDPGARTASCILLGNLATHESTTQAIVELKPCQRLVSLVGEADFELSRSATYALFRIAQRLEGVQAIIELSVLERVLGLLESPHGVVRKSTCDLIKNLACYECAVPAILESKACARLGSLLRDQVSLSATSALSSIAQRLEGAPAIVAKMLDHFLELLESPSSDAKRWTCILLGKLVRHESIMLAILESKACVRLASLLHDQEVFWSAANTLSSIAESPDGAEAIVEAKVLDDVLELLQSSTPKIRIWTCDLIGRLARHDSASTVRTIFESKACARLVSLSSDKDSEVYWSIRDALSSIVQRLEGASCIDAQVLNHVLDLLESPSIEIRRWACFLLGRVVGRESTVPAILLETKSCMRLASLLDDQEVFSSATSALSSIAERPNGAQAVVEAKVLDYVLESLESSSLRARRWTCNFVAKLASHESTVPVILGSTVFARLASFLHDQDVFWSAANALASTAKTLQGAQAIVEARGLDNVLELFESPSPELRSWTCEWVESLVNHEVAAPTILESKASGRLVSSLLREAASDGHPVAAVSALLSISKWPDGVAALGHEVILGRLVELSQSPDAVVQRTTHAILDNLARARA